MLLAIDVGNTHTVFALCDGNAIGGIWRFATDHHRTEDEYASTLLYLMREQKMDTAAISGCIISSVVPDTIFPLKQCCIKYFKHAPLIVGRDTLDLGMKVCIDNPQELGADRLVNAIAAWDAHRKAMIVIDFGTATTFDVISGQGDYLGGVIAPGVNVSLDALSHAAARLHGISIKRPERVIGTSTTTAMQSGIYFGYLGLVDGIVSQIKKEQGEAMMVLATGGLANLYAQDNPVIDLVDQELTMRGLHLIYQRNQHRKAA